MTAVMPRTLIDVPFERSKVRDVAAVVSFALLTAAAAQLSFHVPWTPVPVTGQTFAVLLSGAALGMRLGSASQLLYVVLGAAGLPFYAGGDGGWSAATGATAGYLVGFVVAAALVGALADRRHDRSLVTAVPAMLAGTAVTYLLGVTWLAVSLGVSLGKAVELGLTPFIVGDIAKLVAAGALFPAAWRVTRSRER